MARLLVALVLLAAAARSEDYALLVGCTEYPALKSHPDYDAFFLLYGPKNDAELMRATLLKHAGFRNENITILAGWPTDPDARPTRANILAQFERLAKTARKGDRVLIQMAGHGSQQPDKDGDEPDGWDEVFLPSDIKGWDGRRGTIEGALTDDEIGLHVRAIRDAGAFVWLSMDCCHAGSMVRGAERMRLRRIDPQLLGVPVQKTRPRGGRHESTPIFGTRLDGIVAMYGAAPDKPAPEMMLPENSDTGRWHGLLTYTTCRALSRNTAGLTFRELHARIVGDYRSLENPQPIPIIEGDVEQFVGREGRSDRAPIYLRTERGQLVVDAGQLAGVGAGAVFDVLDGEGVIARVKVAKAGVDRSVCVAVGSFPKLTRPHPVRLVSQPVHGQPLRLCLATNDDVAQQTISRLKSRVEIAKTAAWTLRAAAGDAFTLEPHTGSPLHVPGDKLEEALRRVYRAENLRRFIGSGGMGRLPHGLSVGLLRADGKPIREGGHVTPGERVTVRIRNEAEADFDVTVLALDANCGLLELYPRLQSPRVRKRDRRPIDIGPLPVNDRTQGFEHLVVIAVPREAEDEEISFGWLAQPSLEVALRGGGSDVESLLHDLAFGDMTRGTSAPVGDAHASLVTWQTGWGSLSPPAGFVGTPEAIPAIKSDAPGWECAPRGVTAGGITWAGHERPSQALFDVDGDGDIEVALCFGDRRTAYYDSDGDGEFDLVLIDTRDDPDADVRHSKVGDTWSRREVQQPWLCSGYLLTKDAQASAFRLFVRAFR